MKLKRNLSLLLAAVMAATLSWPYPVYANAQTFQPDFPGQEELLDFDKPGKPGDSDDFDWSQEPESSEYFGSSEEPGETEKPEDLDDNDNDGADETKAAVSNLRADYQAETDKVTISYEKSPECDHVSILVGGITVRESFGETVYIYDCGDLKDNEDHMVEVIPYDARGNAGKSVTKTINIPIRPAVLDPEAAGAEYDLDKKELIIDWSGDNVAYVHIYQDYQGDGDKPLWEEDSDLVNGTAGVVKLVVSLEAKSKHTYKIVPFNRFGNEGKAVSLEMEVDDYVAKIDSSYIHYDDIAKQLYMTWDNGVYTEYVSIYLNDVVLAEGYKENSFCLNNCVLQPGAAYIVTIEPYNDKDEEGEEETEDISYGWFDVPDGVKASLKSVEAKDSQGQHTGFSKPAVYVKWEAQAGAVYDIYRAGKNKKNAYSWLTSVKSDVDGVYTYIDEKIEMGAYYYKICRKVNTDAYVEQALFSALSEETSVKVAVPKPKLKAKLNQKGQAELVLSVGRDFVSGYDIYRMSSGEKYVKIATVTEDEYIDRDVEFGKTYQYKAKAYYYDTASKVRSVSGYSDVSKLKNTVGGMEAEAVALSKGTVQISWTPAANASEYEVYYKTGKKGSSYKLWKTTARQSVKFEVKEDGKHMFMIKAKKTSAGGQTYSAIAKAACTIGFSAPGGLKLEKTSYKFNAADNTLTQKSKLSWNRVYGAKGYYVELYDKTSKTYQRIARVKGAEKTNYTVSNVVTADPQTLKYRVSAYDGPSVKKGGTVKVTPELGTASKVKAVKSGSKVKVSWKKVTGAEYYQVYRSNGRTMHLVGQTGGSSIKDKGLNAEISYQYYVRAVNQSLNLKGADSEPAKCKMANSAKVLGLTAENMRAGIVDLEWNDLTDAQTYIIYFKTDPNGEYQKLKEVSGKKTTFAHAGQPAGRACYYKVTAIQANSGGELLESKAATASVTVTR